MLHLKVTPVVGLPQFTGWSQVAENTTSANSRLICVFAVSGKHSGNVGRDISEQIADFYFYDVEQLHEFIEKLIFYVHENGCKLYISCAFISGSNSIFLTYGGSVFLKRGENAGQILASQDELKLVQGKYNPKDVYVLTTFQATQFLNEIEQKFIQGFDVDIIITSIVPGLHAQHDSSLSAIVFVTKEKQLISAEADKLNEENSPIIQAESELEGDIVKGMLFQSPKISLDVETKDINLENTKLGSISKKMVEILVRNAKRASSILIKFFLLFLKKIISLLKSIDISKIFYFFKSLRERGIKDIFREKTNLDEKKNKVSFVKLFIISIVIFSIVGIVFVFIYARKNEENKIYSLLAPSVEQVSSAQNLLDSDPIKSRAMVLETLTILQNLKNENSSSTAVYIINEQIQSTSDLYEQISGKEELQELNIFYDLRLVKSDYIATDIDLRENTAVLLDSEKKQIIVLDLNTKRVDVKDFSSFDSVKDLSFNDSSSYVLADGIQSFDISGSDEIEEIRSLGDSNRSANFINAYERFVYVINPDKRNIYRYAKDEEGKYSDPVGWMKSATGIKYDEVTSFSIDGDVWLTTSDGQIKKFTSGREENFEIRGLIENFNSSLIAYTNVVLKNLYILEPDNNRLVVSTKEGDFIQEFKSESLASVTTFAVSEEKNKVYAVSGSIIFELNLDK